MEKGWGVQRRSRVWVRVRAVRDTPPPAARLHWYFDSRMTKPVWSPHNCASGQKAGQSGGPSLRRTSADSCGAGRGLPGSLGLGSTGFLSPGEVAGSACPSPVLPAGAQGACAQPPGQPRTLLSSTHPRRRVPRRPTPAGLSLEIALTSLPCPPLPVGPGAPSLHPRLPCPVRNRPARSSREAASSAEWSHVVARAPRTGSGAHARARVVARSLEEGRRGVSVTGNRVSVWEGRMKELLELTVVMVVQQRECT